MTRRQLTWGAVVALVGAVGAALIAAGRGLFSLLRRLLVPEPVFEPGSVRSIGRVSDVSVGVNTRFLQEQRICYLCCNTHG